MNEDEWGITYVHTGRHGPTIVYKLNSPHDRYVVDSSLRSAYIIPVSSFLWSSGGHSYFIENYPPRLPYAISPVICRSADRFFYSEKNGNKMNELRPVARRDLIERPIDALSEGRLEPVLLIRHRVGNANGFLVCITYDMNSTTLVFRGRGIDEKFILAGHAGQPHWEDFAGFQERVDKFYTLYPHQLSRILFQRVTMVVLTLLQSDGMECYIHILASKIVTIRLGRSSRTLV